MVCTWVVCWNLTWLLQFKIYPLCHIFGTTFWELLKYTCTCSPLHFLIPHCEMVWYLHCGKQHMLSHFPRNNLHGRSKKIFVQYRLPQLFQRFLNQLWWNGLTIFWKTKLTINNLVAARVRPLRTRWLKWSIIGVKLQIDARPMWELFCLILRKRLI